MPMWTRRHYAAIARHVRESDMSWGAKRDLVETLVEVFADDNPRFDAEKFRDAAGTLSPPCTSCGEPNGDHLPGCALQESFLAHPAQGVSS